MISNKGFLHSILSDEEWSWDPIIVAMIFSVTLGLLMTMHDVFIRGHQFDFEKLGNGVAIILGAGGAGYGVKRFGEKRGGNDGSSTDVPQS